MAESSKEKIPVRDFFRRLFDQQAAVTKPFIDFSSLLDQELIVWLVLFRTWVREVVWKLMDLDSTIESVDQGEQSKGTIYKMLVPGTPDQLCALFLLRNKATQITDLTPMAFIVWSNVQLTGLVNEIEKRAEKNMVGKKMIEMIFEMAEFPKQQLLDSVQGEARKWRRGGDLFKPYRLDVEERKDREQEVLTACVDFRKQMQGNPRLVADGDLCIPPLPRMANLPRERSEALTRLTQIYTSDDLKAFWRDILPCLQGRAEEIPGRAYQSIRSQDDKWNARKREGETLTLEDFDASTDPVIIDSILYRHVEKRWGERGIKFLAALEQYETVEAASKAAGVSRQTGQKWKTELRKELRPPKKPSRK